jgi:hypothetical protein
VMGWSERGVGEGVEGEKRIDILDILADRFLNLPLLCEPPYFVSPTTVVIAHALAIYESVCDKPE